MLNAFISGFSLGLSFILAIGAQNAFVLKQGIKKEHIFAVVLICSLSDAILISLGVGGFGYISKEFPYINLIAKYGGFAFLFIYSMKSFYSSLMLSHKIQDAKSSHSNLAKTMLITLAFTWLNPHVYLDTVMIIGSFSLKFGDLAWCFGFGAMSASFVFFFSLGYMARVLIPLFKKPLSWKILEFIIGVIMLSLAVMLLLS